MNWIVTFRTGTRWARVAARLQKLGCRAASIRSTTDDHVTIVAVEGPDDLNRRALPYRKSFRVHPSARIPAATRSVAACS
jgi:hypothetical protein